MRGNRKGRLGWIFGGIVVALLVLAALNFEALSFGAGALLAEKRTALLADAQWESPSTARRFATRFPAGAEEDDLLTWLEANDFFVDRNAMHASRSIEGFPCNENVEVIWSSDGAGKLRTSQAIIHEAGCL